MLDDVASTRRGLETYLPPKMKPQGSGYVTSDEYGVSNDGRILVNRSVILLQIVVAVVMSDLASTRSRWTNCYYITGRHIAQLWTFEV